MVPSLSLSLSLSPNLVLVPGLVPVLGLVLVLGLVRVPAPVVVPNRYYGLSFRQPPFPTVLTADEFIWNVRTVAKMPNSDCAWTKT